MFTTRLEDRSTIENSQNLQQRNGEIWVRSYGAKNNFQSGENQLKTEGNTFVTQFGLGLATLGQYDQFNVGVLGGYGTYRGYTRSILNRRHDLDGWRLLQYSGHFNIEKRQCNTP